MSRDPGSADLDRRRLLAAGLGGAAMTVGGTALAAQTTPGRVIATEEGFLTRSYVDAYLTRAARADDPGSRYSVNYFRSAVVDEAGDMATRIADMDRNGVDMHLLLLSAPGVQVFEPDFASSLASDLNDELAAIVRKHPSRLAALGVVAPQAPEAAAREVERIMGPLGLNGILINSHTQGHYLDEPRFRPILAAAEAAGAAIYIHPTYPPPGMAEYYDKYGMIGALWGFAAEAGLHAVRLILSGVFDDFPRLKIVLGHMGESIPYYLSRIDNRYDNLINRRGFADLNMRRLKRRPSEYFRSNFWVTTSGVFWDPVLDFCLAVLGAERIMFSIDYPYEKSAEAMAFLRSAKLSPDQRAKISHAVAEQVFRIAPR